MNGICSGDEMRRSENRMSNTKSRDATSISNEFATMRIQRIAICALAIDGIMLA